MKLIPLTQGKFAQVDDEDFEALNQFKWFAHKPARTFYAARNVRVNGRKTVLYMHRQIMGDPVGIQVDHRDGNGLNNQRENIRNVVHRQNHFNQQKTKRVCSSRYKGVHWHAPLSKWRARITVNRKSIHLGLFDQEIEAAKAYDEAAKKRFGEYARPNL